MLTDLCYIVNAPMFLGQFVVFAAYGIAVHIKGTEGLSVSKTITTLSLVNLLLIPLRNLLYAIAETFSSLSCLQRIQEFLARDPQAENRQLDLQSTGVIVAAKTFALPEPKANSTDIELIHTAPSSNNRIKALPRTPTPAPTISMINNTSTPDTLSLTHAKHLSEVERSISETPSRKTSLTIVVGPVGCGKSTLLKAILGETAYQHKTFALDTTEIAYCAQDPWIFNASVHANIVGFSHDPLDAQWYSTVVQACALDIDFAQLKQGDKTLLGSKGIKLSGGQKQRIVSYRCSVLSCARQNCSNADGLW